jgi:hypothetical protein
LKLESENEIFWSRGTWCVRFYTEEGKKKFDEFRLSYRSFSKTPECLIALGLTETASKEDVTRAYKEFVKKEHPDKGGSHEGFLKLQEHYQQALMITKSKEPSNAFEWLRQQGRRSTKWKGRSKNR